MHSRQDIVDSARSYIGVPFRHQGRHKKAGLDCLGLIVQVARDLGYVIEEVADYARYPDKDRLLAEVSKYAVEIPLEDIQHGDFIIFGYNRRRPIPQHFAYYTGSGQMVQSLDPDGVTETMYDECWRSRAIMAFTFPGLN